MCAVQRLSVIASDVVLLSAVWFATRKRRTSEKHAVRILVAANAGLLLVDHMHFQYNGMLLGGTFNLLHLRHPLSMKSGCFDAYDCSRDHAQAGHVLLEDCVAPIDEA